MLEAHRPKGRFFYGLISLLLLGYGLSQALPVVPADAPATTHVSEGLFGTHSGAQKKESAISFVSAALQLTESVANREIVDEIKFKDGLGKVIDGTVQCLNASSWAQPK